MMSGFFITFEGGEGSGKTTQINRLAERFTAQKIKTMTTREPGGTEESEKIRNLIVQREGGEWSAIAEVLLLNAARNMHVEKMIKPALAEGKTIISDRFFDSTCAYQGYGRGVDLEIIQSIQKASIGDFKPSLTFILDIDPAEGLKRSNRRLAAEQLDIDQSEDRFENLDLDFHKRLRNGFLEIAKNDPERCILIDTTQDIEAMADQIFKAAIARLKG